MRLVALSNVLVITMIMQSCVYAAEDLTLKSGISFVQDTDSGFPIVADKMEDCAIETSMPTFIFFGASGDLNTNRQAKRVVDLYKHYGSKVKFILVDVDHPINTQAIKLIRKYYKGYIPCQVILTRAGTMHWAQIGEVDTGIIKIQFEQIL